MEDSYDKAESVLAEFRKAGALLEGHFILSSGRRSPVFLQKALVFSNPVVTERLCQALAARLEREHERIDVVCGPAIGAIVPAYETARALGCRFVFTERAGGSMVLRRNFRVGSDERMLLLEDHITTGLSLRETIAALKNEDLGSNIIGAACIIDRSGGRADTGGIPLTALARVDFPDYAPEEVPPELALIPPVKPGSREFV